MNKNFDDINEQSITKLQRAVDCKGMYIEASIDYWSHALTMYDNLLPDDVNEIYEPQRQIARDKIAFYQSELTKLHNGEIEMAGTIS